MATLTYSRAPCPRLFFYHAGSCFRSPRTPNPHHGCTVRCCARRECERVCADLAARAVWLALELLGPAANATALIARAAFAARRHFRLADCALGFDRGADGRARHCLSGSA